MIKERTVATAQTAVTPINASLAGLCIREWRATEVLLSILNFAAEETKFDQLEMLFASLFADAGGFAYDTCQAWGSPGMRWMGCDEFFPDKEIYKDLRKSVSSGCSPTKVQFVTEGTVPAYPFGDPTPWTPNPTYGIE